MFEHLWFMKYTPKPGDVIVDIGAGKGEDIPAFCEAVRPGGRVVAVEAHPVIFAECARVCAEQGAECVQAACVAMRGMYNIETCENYEAGFVFHGAPTATSHPVEGKTMSDLLNHFGIESVDLLKMNIEGFERVSLVRSQEILRNVKHAVIACHELPGFGSTLPGVCEVLQQAGFEYWINEEWKHVHAWR